MSGRTRSAKRSAATRAVPGAEVVQVQPTVSLPDSPDSAPAKVNNPAASARISRNLERHEIASLNDRFAALIERNRQLENVNKMLRQKDIQIKETAQRTMERLRMTYEKELAEIRAKGEALTEDTAKLREDHANLELEYNQKKALYVNLSKDVAKQRRQVTEMEDQVVHCSVTIPQVQIENERLIREKDNLKQERIEMIDEVEKAKRQLEHVTMARVQTENLLQAKVEELDLEDKVHEEELQNLVSVSELDKKNAEEMLRQTYDTKLQESIQGLREEFEENLRAGAQTLAIQRGATGGIKNELKKAQHELHDINIETLMVKSQLDGLQQKNTEIEKERQELMKTVQNMEHKSYINHHVFGKMLEEKDSAIETLVAEKEELVNDTQLLMTTKLAVDNEIATYRKLMDGAEQL
ncbi:unnamed protein product [Orchesella dallaii]|uniref:IF rod domain-containing protein n=1 Tax=Orchesella dallaii TaxID=48710 RepID=A0ABP1R8C3_9HEXA